MTLKRILHNKYRALKKRAKERGQQFSLGLADVRRLLSKETCAACSVRMVISSDRSGGAPNYLSIDRIDNSQGYTPDNTEAICRSCNCIKSIIEQNGLERFSPVSEQNKLVRNWYLERLRHA